MAVVADAHRRPVPREPKEQFRFQAREGFTVIEKGNTIRIERSAAEPLVLTMPKIERARSNEAAPLRRRHRGRLAVLLPRLERLLPRHPGAGAGAGRAAPARRCGKRGPGRAGPGAALPGQPALPVQHAQLAVVAGDDRPHRPRRGDAARAVDLLPHAACRSTRAPTSAWPRRSTCSGSISTSRRRASPTGCRSRSTFPTSSSRRGCRR